MRRHLWSICAAVTALAACGGDDTVQVAATPTTDPPDAGLSRRALDEPGSAADLAGVLVRYYEPEGEGPGFDLRFSADGSVHLELMDPDLDPNASSFSSTYDVDEVTALIDGLAPSELAEGRDDCMPEVDGSAPRLSVVEFEVDYCYTNPTEHPLVDLVRSTRARLQAELGELDASEPGDAPGDFPAPTGFDGVLARYSMPGGECDRCDFSTTFRADGTLELRSTRGDHSSTYDVAALGTLLAEFDPATFAIGETDCGREVDGNAPLVAVPEAEIDLCFWEVDAADPLYAFVRAEHERIEAERDAAVADDTVVARVTWTGGLSESGISTSTWEFLADGTWTDQYGDSVTEGTYDPIPLITALGAVYARSPILGPFTGECPTAYDGSELFYELFDPGTGEIVLSTSTCTDDLDPEHPLIEAVTGAVDAALGLTAKLSPRSAR